MKPPALPLAPVNYDPVYLNQVWRILTQYLNQESVDEVKVEQQSGMLEIIQWLS